MFDAIGSPVIQGREAAPRAPEWRDGHLFTVLRREDEAELLPALRAAAQRGRRAFDEGAAMRRIDWAMGLLLSSLPYPDQDPSRPTRARWKRASEAAAQLLHELHGDRENWLGHVLNADLHASQLVSQLEEFQSYLAGLAAESQRRAPLPSRDAQVEFVRRLATFCRSGALPIRAVRSESGRVTPFEQLVRRCLRIAGIPAADAALLLGLALTSSRSVRTAIRT